MAVVQRERPAQERIDVGSAGSDRANCSNNLGERRALRDQPVDTGRESLSREPGIGGSQRTSWSIP